MPFTIELMPTTASPPHVQVQADVRSVVVADGGTFDRDGAGFVTADGLKIKLTDDRVRFLTDEISPGFCRILFDAALRSNSTLDRGGADVTPLKMAGSKGVTRYVRMRTDPIATPAALCVRLERDLEDWHRIIGEAQSQGVLGPDERPLEPPAAPGTEARLGTDPTGVAAHCETAQRAYAKFGWKIVREVVTQNADYGVVWRADVTLPGFRGVPSRVVCWKRPGRDDYSVAFEATESTAPLAN